MLDLADPTKIVARTEGPLLTPVEEYERYGVVENIVFPTGALVDGDVLKVYYGGADTVSCLSTCSLSSLLSEMKSKTKKAEKEVRFKRYAKNPIITPNPDNSWEAKSTFNPTAVYLDNKVHILYRALSDEHTSTVGYAVSGDGFQIEKKFEKPVYVPREKFELKAKPDAYSGCEDARITHFKEEEKLYMCYTAYSGVGKTAIALTSISENDFKDNKWNWAKPIVISDTTRDDKNSCIFPEKVNGKYVFFHRLGGCIWIDKVDDLKFEKPLGGRLLTCPNKHGWDSRKVGIAGPPIKTAKGWLLIFHALSREDDKYRLGAMLLDINEPHKIISRLDYPLIEPEEDYELGGLRHSTVFSCGAVEKDGKLIVYYGGADTVTAVASVKMADLLAEL